MGATLRRAIAMCRPLVDTDVAGPNQETREQPVGMSRLTTTTGLLTLAVHDTLDGRVEH
jgi:hypothetical protein